ncbi:hypothetical protein UT300013_35420 [Paraclostridium sordellii]
MEGNSVIQLINDMVTNGELINSLPVRGMIRIVDDPGYWTIATEALANGVVTFLVSGFSAWIGTVIGSKNTVKLYKAEEEFKVREALRREFYFEYEKLYLIMYDNLEKTIDKIKYVRMDVFFQGGGSSYNCRDMNIHISVGNIEEIEDIEKFLENQKVEDMFKVISELYTSMKMLKNFMKVKEYIHKYKEFKYSDLESVINKAKTECYSMQSTPNSFKVPEKYVENIKLPKGISFKTVYPKKINDFRADLEDIVNQTLVKLMKQLDTANGIHNGINKQFIGDYFKD